VKGPRRSVLSAHSVLSVLPPAPTVSPGPLWTPVSRACGCRRWRYAAPPTIWPGWNPARIPGREVSSP